MNTRSVIAVAVLSVAASFTATAAETDHIGIYAEDAQWLDNLGAMESVDIAAMEVRELSGKSQRHYGNLDGFQEAE